MAAEFQECGCLQSYAWNSISRVIFDVVMSFNEQAKHTKSFSSDDRCGLGCDMFADIRSNLSPTRASSLLRNVDRSVAGNTGLIGEDYDGYGLDGPEL